MSSLRPVATYTIAMLLGVAIGAGSMAWYAWRRTLLNDMHAIEVVVQTNLALLSEIDAGNSSSAKKHLDYVLISGVQLTNLYSKGHGEAANEARELQRRISDWRSRHPGIALSPELSSEIQGASTVVP